MRDAPPGTFGGFTSAILAAVFAGLLALAIPASGAFLQKEFVVCQDQGQDVLCDAYVVRKNDYVTRLFQQRGEIAYRDFPKFLEIFKRLNPAVKDIDLIYPGQRILVPLRIIPPNSLEGQATGRVTIPLITITNIPEQLERNSLDYVVQPGDCISALIARKFGSYSSQPYKEAVEIFKYLNPHIQDLDKIHVGQTLQLPLPAIRGETWYPEIFDAEGALVVAAETPGPPQEEPPEKSAEKPEVPCEEPIPVAAAEPPVVEEPPVSEPPAEDPAAKPEVKPAEEAPPPPKLAPLPSIFKKAAAIFGAELLDSGRYFFPRPGQTDLSLDLAATPVMEFASGRRILFAKTDGLSAADQEAVGAFWKTARVVTLSYDASLRELLYTICRILDPRGCENAASLKLGGVTATVRGELIYKDPEGAGRVCVGLIDHSAQALPAPLAGFLEKNHIQVTEWIDTKDFFGPARPGKSGGSAAVPVRIPAGARPPAVVADLAAVFGLNYQTGVEISFPFAGFQVKARSNLLTIGPGREILVDFGDLQGDAAGAVAATGFRLLQLDPARTPESVITDLLGVMPVEVEPNPMFDAGASRLAIEMPGRLATLVTETGKTAVLITEAACDVHILEFLHQSGVRVLQVSGN